MHACHKRQKFGVAKVWQLQIRLSLLALGFECHYVLDEVSLEIAVMSSNINFANILDKICKALCYQIDC